MKGGYLYLLQAKWVDFSYRKAEVLIISTSQTYVYTFLKETKMEDRFEKISVGSLES